MYEREGESIPLEEAQAAAQNLGLSLDGWSSKYGWTRNAGKTNGSTKTTPSVGPALPIAGDSSSVDISLESPAQSFPNSYLIETGEIKSKRQKRAEESKAIYEEQELSSSLDPRLNQAPSDKTSVDVNVDDRYAGLGIPTFDEQNEFKIEEDDLDVEIVDETNLVFNKPTYNPESGTYERTNSFVNEYFSPEKIKDVNVTLEAKGVKVDDFEGWLKRDELGQEFLERVGRGDFTESTVDETSFEDYAVAKTGLSSAESNQLIQQMELKDLLERYATEINDRTNKKAFVEEYKKNPEKYKLFTNWEDAYDSYIYYNGSNNKINNISEFTDNQFKELKAYEDKLTKKFVDTQLKNSKGEIVGRTAAQSAINSVREAGIAAYRGLAVDPYILINSTLGFDSKSAQLRDSKKLADMRLSHLSKGTYLQPPPGKSMSVDGVQYHLGEDGVLYNLDAEVVANTYLDDKKLEYLYLKVGSEGEEVTFPEQSWKGGAIQFGGVIGALVPQIVGMRGVGSLRRAGSTKGINAINKARKAKGIKPINTRVRGQGGRFASTKETFGVKMPFNVEVLDNVVFSGYYGYQTGMESTFTAAREAGLTEEESYKLANMAGRQMSLLYMGTAPIAPRIPYMKAFDKWLKAPDLLNKAIRGYSKSGNSVNAFKNILTKEFAKNFAKGNVRTLKSFSAEGVKEIVQEDIQQRGEFTIVNKNVNEEAGKKILKQDYTLTDIINTSILSFAAGGLGGAVGNVNSPLANRNKLQNLYIVSQDLKGAAVRLKLSVETGAMTQENADNILRDAANFAKHGNKVPEYFSRNANYVVEATNLIEERSKLESEKKQLDKSMQSGIDESIKAVDDKIKSLDKKVKTEALEAEIKSVEKIAGKDGIKVYNTVAEMKDAKGADGNSLFDNQDLKSDGLFIDDDGTIIINKEVAIEEGAIGVASHELLHRILKSQFGNIGDNEVKVINEVRNSLKGTEILKRLDERANLVDENGKKIYDINFDEEGNVSGQDIDEFITFLSDEMAKGQLQLSETNLQKIERVITDFFKNVFGYNKEFTSGQQVLEFLKDYRTGIKSGKLSAAARRKMEAGDKVKTGKVKKSATPKSLLGDINALLPDEVTTRDQFFDRKVFNPIYNNGNLHPAISNYIRSRSVSKEEAQKIIDSVADRLINFNPEAKRKSGEAKITLGEFIFSNVNFGKLDARKALFEESQETARTQSTDTAEAKEIAAAEESSVQTQDKPTYKTLLQRRVVDAEVVESIKNKVKSVVRVMKTRMDESVSKNVTVKPYIAELRKTMGKQADIDLKKAMGGKKDGQLRKFLLRNKAGILENMTTTWLMTSMPNAVQKKVNGVWTSDWNGKKIDRETVNADNAGRTSGAEMVRRLPNAATKLSDAEFLSNILGADGNPIRGKKESLAKAMAEEISFDIFNEALQDPNSDLAKAFENNQELKGVVLTDAYVTEVTRDVERGNVKRSFSAKQVNEIRAHQPELIKQLEEIGNVTESRLRNALINVYIDNNKTSLTEAQLAEFAKEAHKHVVRYLKKQEVLGKDLFMGFVLNGIEAAKVSDNILKSAGITLKEIFGSFKAMMDIPNVQKERRAVELDFNSQFVKKNGKDGLIKVLKWMGGHNYTSTKIGQGRGQYYANKNDYYENNIALIPGVTFDGKNVFYKGEIVKTPTKPSQSVNKVEVFEKEYDKRKAEAHEAWELLIEFLGFVRATNNPVLWVATMKSLDSNMQSILKAAANVEYYFVGKSISKLRYEHLIPTNYIMLQLSNHFWNKKIDLKKLEEAYVVAIIPTDMDENINVQFKSIMPLRWNPLKDPAWMRYYNSATFGIKDLKAIQKIGGENKGTIYGAKWAEFSNKAYPDAVSNLNELYKEETAPASKTSGVKRSVSLSDEFNNIIERKTGVESYKTYSEVQAKMRGAKKGKFKFFIAPGADDFRGLVNYAFAGKGKQGETDMKFFEEKLLNPYFKGIAAIESARQAIRRDYTAVIKLFKPEHKMMQKKIGNSQFTYDQAVRVYLWEKQGTEVPGLSKRDLELLRKAIADNPSLTEYADAMLVVSKRMEWIEPSDYWTSQTILSDLNSMTEKIGRKKYLEEFIETSDAIFTDENMNKIEALYGTDHRAALEDSLYAMKNGSNRPFGKNKQVNKWLNWINGSTGAIMFFNRRSALLQMLSFTNFTNWTDNNPLKQAAAFANQKQYWSDFAMIFNSDKLKERRSGLKTDVSESEIANAVANGKNSPASALNYILKLGFTPTQIADSFAIATGGAMFYRNRVNSYLKDGMSKKEAEDKAFLDFSKRSDEAQQSSDPALVSMQQRSVLGRLVLAFANTPMQYTRLMKKAGQDLINGRGSFKENVSKIAYYGIVQNFIFSSLQSALFALAFDDEDEEGLSDAEIAKKEEYETSRVTRVLNGMMDTVLRGSGVYGAVVSVVKNTILEYRKQEAKGFLGEDAAWLLQILNLSPPIGSKMRKIYSAARTRRFEKDTIAERGWALTADGKLNLGPNYSVLGSLVSGIANVPLDRIVDELRSVTEALDERNKAWQRIALAFGWKTWDVGALNEEGDLIKAAAKVKRKEAGAEKAKATRESKKANEKIEFEEATKNMTVTEKSDYIKELRRKNKK
jgi:hypothetical protein